jgi:chromosome segregation ATPase
MQEVVQAFMDCDARQKSILSTEGKDMSAASKSEIELLLKQNSDLERMLSEAQDQMRTKSNQEITQSAEIAKLSTSNDTLQQEMTELRSHLEQVERRLVRSEENYRKIVAGGCSRSMSGLSERVKSESSGGNEGSEREGSDSLDMRPADYRILAETRLEEIREKNKRILQLESMNLAASEASEPSEQTILQSVPYVNLMEQLNRSRKECEYHVHRLQLVTAELAEVKERIFEERQKLEQLHNTHIKEQLARLSQLSNQLLEAKQEIRSLQFKLEQKSACDIASKRADELSENLTKLQEEYKRLRAEYELLKQKPDADELRREFREREEKIAKERDVKQIEANDYLDQIRMQERKIAMLMGRNGDAAAHSANGVDTSAQREIDALKKDLEALRNERKDLQRRFLKADRGFNDCNKLYQQVKKEKDALMKDLESLGLSFEDMQEQNVRLLQQMKTKDEEQNELLKQRMKDKTLRETMTMEIASLKLKLEKAEEVLRIREDCVDKCKIDMEQQRQEFLKKKKEEECEAASIAAHRLSLQKKEQAAIEAKREADKAKSELNEQQRKKRDNLQTLQDVQFENSRLLEELATLKSRLQSQSSVHCLRSAVVMSIIP